MYDSMDGIKAGILKDVGTTASDSTWISVKAPELIQPIVIVSPIYSPTSR